MIKLFYNCAIAAGQHKKFLIIFVNTDLDEAYRGLVYDFDLRKKMTDKRLLSRWNLHMIKYLFYLCLEIDAATKVQNVKPKSQPPKANCDLLNP